MMSKLTTVRTLESCLEGIERHAHTALRGLIGMGCHLLAANAIFSNPGKRSDLQPRPTVGQGDGNPAFNQWLSEHIAPLGISRSSCYNYMNAARNCGLTADSTDEDVAQLDLAGRKAKELYSGQEKPAAAALPPVTEWHAAEQLWLPLWDDMHRYAAPEGPEAKALWKLPVVSSDPKQPSLEALEIKLRATLDLITEVKTARAKGRR